MKTMQLRDTGIQITLAPNGYLQVTKGLEEAIKLCVDGGQVLTLYRDAESGTYRAGLCWAKEELIEAIDAGLGTFGADKDDPSEAIAYALGHDLTSEEEMDNPFEVSVTGKVAGGGTFSSAGGYPTREEAEARVREAEAKGHEASIEVYLVPPT